MSDAPSPSVSSVHEDLAFLRSLVDEDWRPGLWTFGAIYLSVGLVLMIHVAISWGAQMGFLPLQGRSMIAAYVVLYGAFSVVWRLISRRARQAFGAGAGASVKGRAGGAALAGAFLGHLVMLGVCVVIAWRQQNPTFLEIAPLALFVFQSAAWFVIHAMRRQAWHLLEAWGWLAAALALSPLVGTTAFGPGVGLAALLLMVLPGLHMMRLARAPT